MKVSEDDTVWSSVPAKVNVAWTLAVTEPSAGPLNNDVSGGVVSTVHVRVAGVGSTLPAASTARTMKACWPSARPVQVWGFTQATKAAPSRLQLNPSAVAGARSPVPEHEKPAWRL